MTALAGEVRRFKSRKEEEAGLAAMRAALQLCCRVDISEALASSPAERAALVARLGRLIERERLRGGRRHWAYDLNRHIALKRAHDMLAGEPSTAASRRPPRKRLRRP